MQEEEFLHFGNEDYVLKMHQRYKENDHTLPVEWVRFFQGMELSAQGSTTSSDIHGFDPMMVFEYFARNGHVFAKTNSFSPQRPFSLDNMLKEMGIEKSQLKTIVSFPMLSVEGVTLEKFIKILEGIYCENMGLEFFAINDSKKEQWLHQRFAQKKSVSEKDKIQAIKEIGKAKILEDFLQKKFLGAKRFSLEGGESFISLVKAIINESANRNVDEGYIAMAHRGRINTLCHIMEKPYKEIFSEFNANRFPDQKGLGDVKYHNGYAKTVKSIDGKDVYMEMASNPSHLEAVNPVLSGMVRARMDSGKEKILGLVVHGDASIAGQGIVYECLQFDKLEGYCTNGNIHIVIDNQIGFTAHPHESRSTLYPTDIAKTFNFPVFHVDASSIEEILFIASLAVEYKEKYSEDVFIHFNCHRLYGHNEADEPMFTNPSLYKKIKERKDIYTTVKESAISSGLISNDDIAAFEASIKDELNLALNDVSAGIDKPKEDMVSFDNALEEQYDVFKGVESKISEETFKSVQDVIARVPEGVNVHKKIVKLIEGRHNALEKKDELLLDFGTAELMAYGSLLLEGKTVRLSGQDSKRGTFSHRHSVYVDQEIDDNIYCPLATIDQGTFFVYNSPLSEYGVMGFEYGYNFKNPDALVIWEAQFGDFYNGASIIIDQYLSSTNSKWGAKSSLVLYLPHGMEGMGPEHSSARIERFLQLCGRANMRVYNPSSSKQMFHLIRSQALCEEKAPLIVFTPKSGLRNTSSTSKELIDGSLEKAILHGNANAEKVVFCSGKITTEVTKADENTQLAVISIEQLYPFPTREVKELLESCISAKKFYFLQEEAKNQGAYSFAKEYIQEVIGNKGSLQYVGRVRLESTATGFSSVHKYEQKKIIEKVLED